MIEINNKDVYVKVNNSNLDQINTQDLLSNLVKLKENDFLSKEEKTLKLKKILGI